MRLQLVCVLGEETHPCCRVAWVREGGSVGAWVRGRVGVWEHECVGRCMSVWAGAWVHGCVGARLRGCVRVRVRISYAKSRPTLQGRRL